MRIVDLDLRSRPLAPLGASDLAPCRRLATAPLADPRERLVHVRARASIVALVALTLVASSACNDEPSASSSLSATSPALTTSTSESGGESLGTDGSAGTAGTDVSTETSATTGDPTGFDGVDDAAIVALDLPATMACGLMQAASVTVRNTGTTAWSRDGELGVKLGAVDDDDPLATPGGTRIYLPEGVTVAPTGEYTFEMTLKAPLAPGVYVSDWQMVREGVHWFGEVGAKEVTVTCASSSGAVGLDGNSLIDEGGKFNALGATMMWAAWAYKFDRPRLEENLAYLRDHGFDYVRALGVVGDPGAPDYWDGREIDRQWPDYAEVIAGLTDLVHDQYGLRIEWTIFGDAQKNTPDPADRLALVDQFLAMSKGREDKIIHFEVANEYWQNGFDGADGLAELRALSKHMKDSTEILVAASAPAGYECEADILAVYGGDVADLATIHFDRDTSKVEGSWRPVRQPWEHGFCVGVPVGANNEPIGPGSSVAEENDPERLVAAAIVTHISGLPLYVFHSKAGVRGDQDLWEMPGVDAFVAMKSLLPGDLASWAPKNAHWADSPFVVYAGEGGQLLPDTMWVDLGAPESGVVRAYGSVQGSEFLVLPIGILGEVVMAPRKAAEFDVIDPMTGAIVSHEIRQAGEQFSVSGANRGALLLRGAYQ
ncbi:MAG: NBR1-Ig-like domain-containing protein [Nannocystaceae bacterium]